MNLFHMILTLYHIIFNICNIRVMEYNINYFPEKDHEENKLCENIKLCN